MLVVSNTSPLLGLGAIGRLDLLHHQFGVVLIPSIVLAELRVDEDLPGSKALGEALAARWIETRPVANIALARVLRRDLDGGEAEAITLALETHADVVLLDERAGRMAAREVNLGVTGTLGVLLRARREGQIASLAAEIAALRTKIGFWISPELEKLLLAECGE